MSLKGTAAQMTLMLDQSMAEGRLIRCFRVGRDVWDYLLGFCADDIKGLQRMAFQDIPVFMDENLPPDAILKEYA